MVDEQLSAILIIEELKARLKKIEELVDKMHENACKIADLIKEYIK